MPDPDSFDVDLLLASLRADHQDVSSYFEVLAGKLEGALGDRVEVERGGGLFRHRGRASRITMTFADDEYAAQLSSGMIESTIRHVVRGITLRTDQLDFADWLRNLVDVLAVEAKRSDSTRVALEGLLA